MDAWRREGMVRTGGNATAHPQRPKAGQRTGAEPEDETTTIAKPTNAARAHSSAVAWTREAVRVVVPCAGKTSDIKPGV